MDTHEDEPPAKRAEWPVTEGHRRAAAKIAAAAIDSAEWHLVHPADGGGADAIAKWLDIAERASRIAGPWRMP